MNKVSKYFRGVAEEARRVRWPNTRELVSAVIVVLVITIVCGLSLLLSDWIASQIMKAFEAAFPKASTETSSSAAAMLLNQITGGRF